MVSMKYREARREREAQALESGTRFQPKGNDVLVIAEFTRRGIPLSEIETFGPRQNVRTYNAWRALGRQVRKGERGVAVTVFGQAEDSPTDDSPGGSVSKRKPRRFAVRAYVFHVSQTDPASEAARC